MGKLYTAAGPDVARRIDALRDHYYGELEGVTIGALFVADEDEQKRVLTHKGYPAAALIRIVNLRDRVAGQPDAQIVIDQFCWQSLEGKKQTALLDHELFHLERITDKHGANLYDTADRPKLRIRKHDWQFGWFDQIAKRHGEHALEVLEARRLLSQSGQLYFDFGPEVKAA